MPCEKDCKHNQGFIFHATPMYKIIGMWCCNLGCGFWLNFNPEFRDFPSGVAYTEEPGEWRKSFPKLSSNPLG